MNRPQVAGALYPATPAGFKSMLTEANQVHRDGYELVTITPVGDHIGAVYKRSGTPAAGTHMPDNNSFFE